MTGTSSSAVMSLGVLVTISHLSGARAKWGSKIFPLASRLLIAGINSFGLSSFVRVMAAST